jgi:hypothetical protein
MGLQYVRAVLHQRVYDCTMSDPTRRAVQPRRIFISSRWSHRIRSWRRWHRHRARASHAHLVQRVRYRQPRVRQYYVRHFSYWHARLRLWRPLRHASQHRTRSEFNRPQQLERDRTYSVAGVFILVGHRQHTVQCSDGWPTRAWRLRRCQSHRTQCNGKHHTMDCIMPIGNVCHGAEHGLGFPKWNERGHAVPFDPQRMSSTRFSGCNIAQGGSLFQQLPETDRLILFQQFSRHLLVGSSVPA